jgi:ribosome maturation factor RimP
LPLPVVAELEHLSRQVGHTFQLDLQAVHLFTHRIPMTVQVLIQRADGGDVSLDDCAAFSAPLGEAIEASGLLEAAYVLEVSSPGIAEELQNDRDFASFRGFPVQLLRREAAGDEVSQEGLLLGRDADAVLLNIRGRSVRIPRDQVVKVRLVAPTAEP